MTLRMIILIALLPSVLVGCATGGGKNGESTLAKADPKAAERARPYIVNHYGLDFRSASTGGVCVTPKATAEWKTWVLAAGTCVQKSDWPQVEKLGVEMSARHVDSPWGPYFLGVAAAQRGEMLRAHWMFEMAEKKAGVPIGLVHYEKARLIEKTDGPALAAKEMQLAVKADPTLLPGFLWLAQVHHRDGMNADAERYYRAVLALKDDNYSALVGLGDIMVEKQNGAEAVELLSRAIALKSDVVETRSKLAFAYENLTKEPVKALHTLRDLRVAIEKGRVRGKTAYDLGAKIKSIEQSIKPESTAQARDREPAQDKKKGG